MDDPTIQFLKQIGTALSCTVVLGIGCWKLWAKVEKKDADIEAINKAHAEALLAEQKRHDDEMKAERDRHATEEKAKDEKIYAILGQFHGIAKGD